MDSGKLGAYCFESITYNELNEPSRVNTEFQFWLRQELNVCFQAHYYVLSMLCSWVFLEPS